LTFSDSDRPDGKKKAYVRLTADHDALDVANKVWIFTEGNVPSTDYGAQCRLALSRGRLLGIYLFSYLYSYCLYARYHHHVVFPMSVVNCQCFLFGLSFSLSSWGFEMPVMSFEVERYGQRVIE
jgi:hypothetical protein